MTLVLFDVFGPFDQRPKLITDLVRSVRSGVPLDATTGDQPVCPVYIDDVCAAFVQAAQIVATDSQPGHAMYAVDSGMAITSFELADSPLMFFAETT